MKKIMFIFGFLLVFWNVFAYNLQTLPSVVNTKLASIENKIKNKYNDENLFCRAGENYYKRLLTLLTKIEKKYPSYKSVFDIVANVAKQRENNLVFYCNWLNKTNNSNYNITKVQEEESKQNDVVNQNVSDNNSNWLSIKWDFLLKNNISLELLKLLLDTKPLVSNYQMNTSVNLNKIEKIDAMQWNYSIKIWNIWYSLSAYSYFVLKTTDISQVKAVINNYSTQHQFDYAFYYIKNWETKVFILKKSDISKMPFSLDESILTNLKKFQSEGWIYIDNFIYWEKLNWSNFAGLFLNKNSLYMLVMYKEIQFYTASDIRTIYRILKIVKNPVIIYSKWVYYITSLDYYKLYEIWNIDFYKKIWGNDYLNKLVLLSKILYPSFYNIATINYPYSLNDLKDIILFVSKFNNKKLSDYYKWILYNIHYNKEISDLINSKWFTNDKLMAYLKENHSYSKNWILFYTFKNKIWVCQTISDLFSLGALFNWLNWEVIDWYSNRWYSHQVSKIWTYYYDPTYDLYSKKLTHFWMSLNTLENYFKPYNN